MLLYPMFYDNAVSAYVPQWWATQGVAILQENMVAANLIHRDFDSLVAKFGDTVNTRKPAELDAPRKTVTDSVTIQDVSSTNIAVPLDQYFHVSFMIRDGEESKSFTNLIDQYVGPAMLAMARAVDRVILGQHIRFWANANGGVGKFTSTAAKNYILDARQNMNVNKAPMEGRNLIVTPGSETELLKLDIFTQAQQVGDEGTALREASLGRKLGYDIYMCQNASGLQAPASSQTFQINNASGYAAGTTTLTVDTGTGSLGVAGTASTHGIWVTIAGDDIPQRVTAHTETLSNTTSITISPGLKRAVADNAVVTGYNGHGLVNLVAGYAAGWSKDIAIDGITEHLQVGQPVSFTGDTNLYTVISYTKTSSVAATLRLDRPLVAALTNDQYVWGAPSGCQYNFAFTRNALTLVNRPLALPAPNTGVQAAVAEFNGISMRVCLSYQAKEQGMLVTFDMLCGIQMLDVNLGAVIFG